MSCILALDQGTTGSTALVLDQDGTVLGRGYREVPQSFPEPGWVEHDPEALFTTVCEAARDAMTAAGARPAAVGITNQRETVVLWERDTLRPVAPAIVWQDRRTAERCRALRSDGSADGIRRRTGLMVDPYFSATKIEWLLRGPGLLRRAARGELAVGTVDAWLVAKLTNGTVHVTDHTNASRTMLYRLDRKEWDPELLSLFGVPAELLPRVVPSSGVVGEAASEHLGHAIPIAGLVGDQQGAMVGQGCVTKGSAKNTYGTGAFLLVHAGDALPRPGEGLLATVVCDSQGRPSYGLEGSLFIAGAAVQWLRDGLGIIQTAAETDALARSVPDSGGVAFVPAFVGLGSPHWEPEARGTITGLTRGTTRAHVARATLESMAFGSRDLLHAMTGRGKQLRPTAFRVDGGASANDWLMQFQADILDLVVERPANIETTAVGAGVLAGLAVGLWPSVEEFARDVPLDRFEPRMEPAERERRLAEWHRAVEAALAWARGGERGV